MFGGKCLDANGQGRTNGTQVIIWDCNGQTNQQWNVNTNGTITGVQSGLCLDANGAATANGTKLILWACNGQANQQWSQSATTTRPPPAPGSGPCDIYAAGGTPCVAAHSTTRALFHAYGGNLYQVRRSSDNATRDIGVSVTGGTANAAAQDSFCAGTTCVITVVYDQSGRGNDLWYQGSTVVPGSPQSSPPSDLGVADGGRQQGVLAVHQLRQQLLARRPSDRCAHRQRTRGHVHGHQRHPRQRWLLLRLRQQRDHPDGRRAGAMDSINFSTQCWFGGCSGTGPWVQADLEFGLYSGGSQSWNTNQRAFRAGSSRPR